MTSKHAVPRSLPFRILLGIFQRRATDRQRYLTPRAGKSGEDDSESGEECRVYNDLGQDSTRVSENQGKSLRLKEGFAGDKDGLDLGQRSCGGRQ